MSTPNTVIPDVQNLADTRQIAINKVGIKSIRHPIKVQDKSGGIQHNGHPVTDETFTLTPQNALYGKYHLLRRGKKNFALLVHS